MGRCDQLLMGCKCRSSVISRLIFQLSTEFSEDSIDTLGFIKIKNFIVTKDIINEIKIQEPN